MRMKDGENTGAGGLLHGRMTGSMRELQMATNQHFRPELVSHNDPSNLIAALRAFARHALATTPDLTLKERRYLYEMTRDDGEQRGYGFTGMIRLLEIAPRTANPHLLPEAIRAHVVRAIPHYASLSVTDTTLAETATQGPADVAQSRFLVERTATIRDLSLEKSVQHWDELRRYLDALHAWTPNGRTFA